MTDEYTSTPALFTFHRYIHMDLESHGYYVRQNNLNGQRTTQMRIKDHFRFTANEIQLMTDLERLTDAAVKVRDAITTWQKVECTYVIDGDTLSAKVARDSVTAAQQQLADIEQKINEQTPAREEPEMAINPKKKNTLDDASPWSRLLEDLESTFDARLDDAVKSKKTEIEKMQDELRQNLADNSTTLHVNINNENMAAVEGLRHNQLEQLISVAAQRLPVLMVGMAGTGKTHAAAQTAEALGLEFYAMSVGAQTSKSDIMGYMHAGGEYVSTHFRKAFEEGGVFLMDEMDAGNANVLIQVNAALSNGYCAFPDAMVKKHNDFVFIASANTFGNGANRQYVGRNQLDAATLDRFVLLEWMIDTKLEEQLAGTDKDARKWYGAVKSVRQAVEREGMRVLVTPRATQRGAKLLAAGVPMDAVAELALYKLFPQDKQAWAKEIGNRVLAAK